LASLIQRDNFETFESIPSEILVSFTFDDELCEILSFFSSLFEDSLQNSIHYPVNVIHCLILILCKITKYNKKLSESLVIFLRKYIFSGQKNFTKIGIISLSHMIYENVIAKEDFNRIFEWISTIFVKNEINENTYYLLELFEYNVDKLDLVILFPLNFKKE
jgi:hypothetical protein